MTSQDFRRGAIVFTQSPIFVPLAVAVIMAVFGAAAHVWQVYPQLEMKLDSISGQIVDLKKGQEKIETSVNSRIGEIVNATAEIRREQDELRGVVDRELANKAATPTSHTRAN